MKKRLTHVEGSTLFSVNQNLDVTNLSVKPSTLQQLLLLGFLFFTFAFSANSSAASNSTLPTTATSNGITMDIAAGCYSLPSFTGFTNTTFCDLDAPITLTGNLPGSEAHFDGPGITDNGDGTATFTPANAIGAGTVRYLSTAPLGLYCPTVPVWSSISAGYYNTLAIKTDGTLWGWGNNQYGTTNSSDIPVQLGTDTNWASVSTGPDHSLAIKTDGTLWAWGGNGSGQLGIGNYTDQTVPVQVGTDTDWASVSAGVFYSLVLKTDGTLWGWGYNALGQLGIGNNTDQNSPVQVGTDTNWASVSLGEGSSLARKTDGTLWAWGNNYDGQLGIGTSGFGTNQTVPVQVGTDTDWASVSIGSYHSLARKTDGTLWAWGYNSNGQLGIGNTTNQTIPVQVGTDTDWASVSAGGYHSLALKTNSTLWAWGYNFEGQLGIGNNTNQTVPVQVGTDTYWGSVSAGLYHSLALTVYGNGSLWAWGAGYYGQLGNGNTTDQNSPVLVITASASTEVVVNICLDFTGLDPQYCDNAAATTLTGNHAPEGTFDGPGITDNGDGTATFDPTTAGTGGAITYTYGGLTWTTMAAGYYHALAIKTNGTLWGWGYNGDGELGNGTYDDSSIPVQSGTDTDWANVAAGYYHSLGIKTDGTLWGWGYNYYGELGPDADTYNPSPIQINKSTHQRAKRYR